MNGWRMPKAAKEKWLAALRDGPYSQGTGLLSDVSGRHCCLGVLQCEVDGYVERDRKGNSLGAPTVHWLQAHGMSTTSFPISHLVSMNDFEQKSFLEIADWIEENIAGVDTDGGL